MSVQVAPQIKGRMMEKGSVLIGYQPLGAKVNFFRCVFSNPATQHQDIDFLLDEIIWLGHDLWPAMWLFLLKKKSDYETIVLLCH